MGTKLSKNTLRRSVSLLLIVLTIVISTKFVVLRAYAGVLSSASVQMGDSRPSQTSVTYTINWTFPGTTSIKCIQVLFGNSVANIGSTAPTGMTNGSSGAIDVTTNGGLTPGSWSYYNGNSAGTAFQFENGSGEGSTATAIQVTVSGVTNTSDSTYYAQIKTWSTLSTHTCSGSVDSSNVIANVTTSGVAVSATVDPSITFSVTGFAGDGSTQVNGAITTNGLTTTSTTVPFGTITSSTNKVAYQTLGVTTNALHGYTVYARYTAALTDSSADTIDDFTGTNSSPATFSSPGTEAFGYTTDDSSLGTGTAARFTSSGGNKWAKFTTTNQEVAYNNAAVASQNTKFGYQLGIAGTTEPGTYTTTVTLTATPSY